MSDIVKRLRWWDLYFNTPEKVGKFVNDHPDYRDDPTSFDETAVEADLRGAADEIESFRGMFRALEPMPGAHLRSDGSPCHYLGSPCTKCGFISR